MHGKIRGQEHASGRSIANLAQRVAGIEARIATTAEAQKSEPYSDEALATVAARLYKARQRRARHFDAAMFSDPAWDMLLDLFIAKVRGKEVRTLSLCVASGAPGSTALRWIAILAKNGLIERRDTPEDRRAKIVSLTMQGYRVMRRYLIEGIEANDLPCGGFV
jgi:DNA-binding MarR family transcriptional regulator